MILDYLKILTSKEKFNFFILVFFILVTALLETVGIGFIIPIINIYLNPEFLNEYNTVNFILKKLTLFNTLEYTLLIYVIFFFSFKTFIIIFFKYYETKYFANIATRLSSDLFNFYINKKYEFFLKNNSSILIRNTIQEVKIFVGNVLGSIINILSEFLLFVFLILLAMIFQPKVTIYVVVFFIILLTLYYIFVKKIISKWGEIRQKYDGSRIKTLQESFGGNKDIKILKAENKFSSSFYKDTLITNNMMMRIKFVNAIPKIIIEYLAITIVMFFLFLSVRSGGIDNTISAISIFAIIGIKLLPSINKILSALQSYRFGKISYKKLHNINSINELENDDYNKVSINEFKKLEFIDVSYTYPSKAETNDYIIKNFSLEILKGDFISIEGISGSGKSTIVDLMTSILEPTKGRIIINGEYQLESVSNLNQILGYCPQKVFLIDDSIKSNIALGVKDKHIDEEKINDLFSMVYLDEMVRKLPEKANTLVGEKGVKISGGQLQRIGIARAIYNNPKLLILDEATNSINSDLEEKIINNIRKKFPDLIIVFISHGNKVKYNFSKVINLSAL